MDLKESNDALARIEGKMSETSASNSAEMKRLGEEQTKIARKLLELQQKSAQASTEAEVKSVGLRAGLRRMGYALSTVTVKSSAQVKANVARLTASAKAEMKAKVEARDKVLQDSLILAAVGLNRNIFKDYENTLRNELVASLHNAGVRNASRIVRAAFEKYGTDYSKKLMMIASDIADLPEETREGLASQLDMTMEAEEDVMADPNLYGDPVMEAEEDDYPMASVEAALRNPIKASTVKSSVSVDAPLPFVHF